MAQACLKAAVVSVRSRIFQDLSKNTMASVKVAVRVRPFNQRYCTIYFDMVEFVFVNSISLVCWRYFHVTALNTQGKSHGSPGNNRDGRQENQDCKHQSKHVKSQTFFCCYT